MGERSSPGVGPRFAIYFVPAPETALYRFGTAVLGYDCYSGLPIERLLAGDASAPDWATLTAEPRTYGFHATLKAPFRLNRDADAAHLLARLRALAASIPAAPTFIPAVELISGFVAIIPQIPSPATDRLAADCVTAFERFRAPLTTAERERRMATGLNASQARNLEQWGYPYVFEEFRFHMTLTGRVTAEQRTAIHAYLREAFARDCGPAPIAIDRLVLVCQESGDASFRVVGHAPIGG
jgi:putative phosphonate metabolism protein